MAFVYRQLQGTHAQIAIYMSEQDAADLFAAMRQSTHDHADADLNFGTWSQIEDELGQLTLPEPRHRTK